VFECFLPPDKYGFLFIPGVTLIDAEQYHLDLHEDHVRCGCVLEMSLLLVNQRGCFNIKAAKSPIPSTGRAKFAVTR
jgi:hypothetical protein